MEANVNVRDIMRMFGLYREGEEREGKVWDGRRCKCGSHLTYDDGYGNTCAECGRWKAGGSGYVRKDGGGTTDGMAT